MLIYCIRWKGRSTTQLQDHIGSFVQGGTIKIDLQQALHVHVSAQTVRNGLCEGGMRPLRPQVGPVLTLQHCAARVALQQGATSHNCLLHPPA